MKALNQEVEYKMKFMSDNNIVSREPNFSCSERYTNIFVRERGGNRVGWSSASCRYVNQGSNQNKAADM